MAILSMILLTIVSGILALFGFVMLTPATNGVGAIALGCLAAILARMAQASAHQRETRDLLKREAAPGVLPPTV